MRCDAMLGRVPQIPTLDEIMINFGCSGFHRESVAVDEMRRKDEHLAQTSRDECHCTFPMRGAVTASTGNTNHTRPLSMQKEYKVPQLEPSL